MTRVLLVGQGPPVRGGIPSFMVKLAEDLRARPDHIVEFLNTTPAGDKRPGGLTRANLRQLFEDARAVARAARRHDIVHLNLAPAPLLPLLRAAFLVMAARTANSKVILHVHSGRIGEYTHGLLYRNLWRITARLGPCVVVVSVAARDSLTAIGVGSVWVSNGVDLAEFKLGASKDSPELVTFVGTVCERKGILDLAEALRRLRGRSDGGRGFRVLVVGDARQEGPGVFERVRAHFLERGLKEVEFLGERSREEVIELLGRSSIFCLPSHWEGEPLSILEAMASGNAVIATEVGGLPEMLDGGRAGVLVPVGEVDALSEALLRLLDDPAERSRLGAAARTRVAHRYSWATTVESITRLYESLMGHSR